MLYKYEATTPEGKREAGTVEAVNIEIAIRSLQSRNLIIISIKPEESSAFSFGLTKSIRIFDRVKVREVVVLSRQLATLFEAKIPVIESFELMVEGTENPLLRRKLLEVIEDIKAGSTISQAMMKHPDVFSRFYVSMVRVGEEAGKLDEIFSQLADHLERSYELSSKVKSALFYPSFVLGVFVLVIILMMIFVVPKLSAILTDTGQKIPIYTKIVIGASGFFRDMGPFLLAGLVAAIIFLWRYGKTRRGKAVISRAQLSIPIVGNILKKFYLSRVTDSLETLLSSGISMVRTIEITADLIDNDVYKNILAQSSDAVKGGNQISDIFSKYEDIPRLVSQMIKIGEESGKLTFILKTLGRYYKREVDNTIENLIGLLEPVMIVMLGLFVGILLVSILGPIYNIASSIQ